jgi:hypothetical protein
MRNSVHYRIFSASRTCATEIHRNTPKNYFSITLQLARSLKTKGNPPWKTLGTSEFPLKRSRCSPEHLVRPSQITAPQLINGICGDITVGYRCESANIYYSRKLSTSALSYTGSTSAPSRSMTRPAFAVGRRARRPEKSPSGRRRICEEGGTASCGGSVGESSAIRSGQKREA